MSLPLKVRVAIGLVIFALVAVIGVALLGTWIEGRTGVEQKPASPQVVYVRSDPTPVLSEAGAVFAPEMSEAPLPDPALAPSVPEASSPTLRLSPNPASVPLNKIRETRIEISEVTQFYGIELR